MDVANHPKNTAHAIGKLCVGGDWACAHGDIATLGIIAARLAEFEREPLHCELVELAGLCRSNSERAVEIRLRLKREVLHAKSRAS